jgi:predicted transcriptional regulator of viral defense system
MERLTEIILKKTNALPEGAPVSAKMLLHLGTRPAIDQSLSRLVRRGKLLRAGRGVYVSPVVTRFGSSAPLVEKLIGELSVQRGETIVPSGASSANALGLTTQVPVRTVYLTSGRSRKLMLGKQERVREVLKEIEGKVPQSEIQRINQHISLFPGWMASALSQSASYA